MWFCDPNALKGGYCSSLPDDFGQRYFTWLLIKDAKRCNRCCSFLCLMTQGKDVVLTFQPSVYCRPQQLPARRKLQSQQPRQKLSQQLRLKLQPRRLLQGLPTPLKQGRSRHASGSMTGGLGRPLTTSLYRLPLVSVTPQSFTTQSFTL